MSLGQGPHAGGSEDRDKVAFAKCATPSDPGNTAGGRVGLCERVLFGF